jgi:hypothetical protein
MSPLRPRLISSLREAWCPPAPGAAGPRRNGAFDRATIRLFVVAITVAIAACGGDPGAGGDPDANAVCVDTTTMCTGNTFQRCTGGQWVVDSQCPVLCDNELGCVVCSPGTRSCNNDDALICTDDGSGTTVIETCTGDAHCFGGTCVDLCANAAANSSYIGCEYFAADLDNAIEILEPQLISCQFDYGIPGRRDIPVCWNANAPAGRRSAGLCDPGDTCPPNYTCRLPPSDVCVLDAAHSPFAIVVSNPQHFTVDVTLSNAAGTTRTVQVTAGEVRALFPQQLGFPDQSIDRSVQAALAYRIVSDAPVVAYQFNPLHNVDVFSNDGSLLIPVSTWDAEYYVMSWPTLTRRPASNDYNSYLTVIAADDATVVEVTPRATTRANGSIAAIAAGATATFTLAAFEVLNLEAIADGDLTGSLIRSDKPVGVFGGHEAIVVEQSPRPNAAYPNGPCCADHVEEMMFPTSTWGKEFAIARSQVRNMDRDRLRIMAQRDGTAVTFNPAPSSGSCATLAAGQFCEVKIAADTAITSTEPVLIGHFLESTIWQDTFGTGSIGNGDPSLALAVPIEQFRDNYTILVPSQYESNYVAIATTATGVVRIDDNDVTGLQPFAGQYRAGRFLVGAGQHTISCSARCSVLVMGYSDAVSYLFAGGLDLNVIVVD